jgi:hypothetical protein
MWDLIHEFIFDADARTVYEHILGPAGQQPREIVLANGSYRFTCRLMPGHDLTALYSVALWATLYLLPEAQDTGQPVVEGELARIGLDQPARGRCLGRLAIARSLRGREWRYEDSYGGTVDITGTSFVVAAWRAIIEDWMGRSLATAPAASPWPGWAPSEMEVAELKAAAQDLRAIRTLLEQWLRVEERRPARAGGRRPEPDDDWAYAQIKAGRPSAEVYRAWLRRIAEPRRTQLVDPYDAFKKAMRRRRRRDGG